MTKPAITPFGQFVAEEHGGDYKKVAAILGYTTSYLRMLGKGAATPKLGFALKIDEWSAGKVPPRSWRPWCSEFSEG